MLPIGQLHGFRSEPTRGDILKGQEASDDTEYLVGVNRMDLKSPAELRLAVHSVVQGGWEGIFELGKSVMKSERHIALTYS
jgi:hypothetical protein